MKRLAIAALVFVTACGGGEQKASGAAGARADGGVDLTGAGATFPYPLYSRWFNDYAASTGVKINYQSIGSGGGIRQLSEQTVDFGASDAPMKDDEMAKAKGGRVLHIPTVLGAVAVTYNVPGLSSLKLTGDVLADIFLGRITKWNDPRIAALNAGAALPAQDILVVRRSDGSGTTFIFTDYLAAVSPSWSSGPGKGKEVQWPVGLGGKGNEGVAGQVKQTPGAIGYVELAYAKQNKLPVVALRNAAGNFVLPSVEGATAAAEGVAAKLGDSTDYRVSIVNAPGAQAYPISSFTWLLVYAQQPDSAKARKLVAFLHWALTEGEGKAASLDYAPLPESMTPAILRRVDALVAGVTTSTAATTP